MYVCVCVCVCIRIVQKIEVSCEKKWRICCGSTPQILMKQEKLNESHLCRNYDKVERCMTSLKSKGGL